MDLDTEMTKALGAHIAWRARLVDAVESGDCSYDIATVAADDKCEFGKWLNDNRRDLTATAADDYATVVDLHARFHRATAETLRKVSAGDDAGARADLSGAFARASAALVLAMSHWRRNSLGRCPMGWWGGLCRGWGRSLIIRFLVVGGSSVVILAAAAAFVLHAAARHHLNGAETTDLLAALVATPVIGGSLAALFIRRLVVSVSDISSVLQRLASGEEVAEIPYMNRGDEIGDIARAMLPVREQSRLVGVIAHESAQIRKRAEMAQHQGRIDMVDALERRIKGVTGAIDNTAKGLHSAADSLSANADTAQQRSAAVAAATDQATANVQTVSAAGTELTASIQEIGRQVTLSAEIARTASSEAADAIAKISGLAQSAVKIGEVVKLINDIASQTNLLALNATIESARAGEAGKGFAVVAGEVKNLANQTGRATEDIADQIKGVQEETESAVQAIEGIGKTIAHINELSATIAAAVEEQGAATQEISRNVEQVSAVTRDVATNISGVAQAASQTGDMARGVFKLANDVLSESDALGRAVEAFLAEMRGGATADGEYMVWDEAAMATGNSVIDTDHKALVRYVNDLGKAMLRGESHAIVGSILNGLAKYTMEHFAREEEIWRSHKLNNFAQHKKQHDDLVARVKDVVAKFNAGTLAVNADLMEFLRDWLANHIMKTDRQSWFAVSRA